MRVSKSSPEFLYCLGLIVTIVITLSCVCALIPIAIVIFISRIERDELGAAAFKNAVNNWNLNQFDAFSKVDIRTISSRQPSSTTFYSDNPLLLNDAYKFSGNDYQEFGIPTYEGRYFRLPNLQLYKDVQFEKDMKPEDVPYIEMEFDMDVSRLAKFIPMFVSETRLVENESNCQHGSIVGRRLCKSSWRLTGACMLLNGTQSGHFLGETNSGCFPGPASDWRIGIYDVEVAPGEKYEASGSVTVRSEDDPAVLAAYTTNDKNSYISVSNMKIVISTTLLIGCIFTIAIAASLACVGTICVVQAKRMDREYQYQEVSQEADQIFGDDLTDPSDSENDVNRRYRGDGDEDTL